MYNEPYEVLLFLYSDDLGKYLPGLILYSPSGAYTTHGPSDNTQLSRNRKKSKLLLAITLKNRK